MEPQEPRRKIFPKQGACSIVLTAAEKSSKMKANERMLDLPTCSLTCLTRANYGDRLLEKFCCEEEQRNKMSVTSC